MVTAGATAGLGDVIGALVSPGEEAAEALGLSAPKGSTFLFPYVSNALDERGLDGFLGDLAEAGVLVAPGPSFGPYRQHVRLCFTAAPPEDIRRGIEILASKLKA